MANFKVTQDLMQDMYDKGLTVKEMADKITELSDTKCSPASIRQFAEHYKINLRRKPKKSQFDLDEVDEDQEEVGDKIRAEIGELAEV